MKEVVFFMVASFALSISSCAPYTQQVCTGHGSCATSSILAVDENHSYVVTVEHFLQGQETADMRMPGRNELPYYLPKVSVVKQAKEFDLALFRLRGDHGKANRLCKKDEIQNGDKVVSFSQDTNLITVNGVTHSTSGLQIKKEGTIIDRDGLTIKTTIFFEHGESGSPVMSKKHNCVVGLAAANVSNRGDPFENEYVSSNYEGMVVEENFSFSRIISAEMIRVFLAY